MVDKPTANFLKKWFSGAASEPAPESPKKVAEPRTILVQPRLPAVLETPSQTFHIFTDGACSANGQRGAKAGYGVHFYSFSQRSADLSVRLDPAETQTNNRAELRAIEAAVDWLDRNPLPVDRDVCIWTDSEYSLNSLTKWAEGWRRNGWRKRDGTSIVNLDIIRPLSDRIRMLPQVRLRHVEGHKDSRATEFPWCGNAVADKLATGSLQTKN